MNVIKLINSIDGINIDTTMRILNLLEAHDYRIVQKSIDLQGHTPIFPPITSINERAALLLRECKIDYPENSNHEQYMISIERSILQGIKIGLLDQQN